MPSTRVRLVQIKFGNKLKFMWEKQAGLYQLAHGVIVEIEVDFHWMWQDTQPSIPNFENKMVFINQGVLTYSETCSGQQRLYSKTTRNNYDKKDDGLRLVY